MEDALASGGLVGLDLEEGLLLRVFLWWLDYRVIMLVCKLAFLVQKAASSEVYSKWGWLLPALFFALLLFMCFLNIFNFQGYQIYLSIKLILLNTTFS